jgi:KUP system potassium uptake protein
MYGWYFGRKIKNRHITFVNLKDYYEFFIDIKQDKSVPKFATNLVYIIKANRQEQVESKVIYSIFKKQPKKADVYWLLHVDKVDDPYRLDYKVNHLIPGVLIRVDFHIGFKVNPGINLYFKQVIEDLVRSGEINLDSGYESLKKYDFPADFRFIVLDRIMIRDFKLSNSESFILILRSIALHLSLPEEKGLQLDPTNTIVEKVPIIIAQPLSRRIERF